MKKATKARNTARRSLPEAMRAHCFKKGSDPKRWKHGQKSKAAVATTRDIQEWLSKIGEEVIEELGQTHNEALARKLWGRAVQGDMEAAKIVLERILGKAVQPVSGSLTLNGKLSIEAMRRSAKETKDAGADN